MPEPGPKSSFLSEYLQRTYNKSDKRDQINPEEVKSAIGVFTVFMVMKAYDWWSDPSGQKKKF
jgi:hypothetical protein